MNCSSFKFQVTINIHLTDIVHLIFVDIKIIFYFDFRRRGSVGSHILRNNNLAQDVLNGSGMSSGNAS